MPKTPDERRTSLEDTLKKGAAEHGGDYLYTVSVYGAESEPLVIPTNPLSPAPEIMPPPLFTQAVQPLETLKTATDGALLAELFRRYLDGELNSEVLSAMERMLRK
jgi:hypothetical protein